MIATPPGQSSVDETTRPFVLTAGETVQVLTLCGAGAYAGAWLFFAFLFSRFNLTPEQAGIDASFLVVRAGVVAGVLGIGGVTLLGSSRVGGFARRGRNGDLLIFNIGFGVLTLGLALSTFVLCEQTIYYLHGPTSRAVVWSCAVVFTFTTTVLIGSLFLRGFRLTVDTAEGPRLLRKSRLRFLASGFLLILLLLVPAVAALGIAVGDHVRNGHSIDTPFFQMQRVHVISLDSAATPKTYASTIANTCFIKLGSHDEHLFLWDPTVPSVLELPVNAYGITIGRCGKRQKTNQTFSNSRPPKP